MKVIIGIATRNRSKLLIKAIASALSQDYIYKQVVVFDDASTDETPLLQHRFQQVKWFRSERQQGYLMARNFLMQQNSADFYFSLDDDAWFLEQDEVSKGVSLLNEYPNVAAIAYDILSPERPNPRPRTEAYPTSMFIGCGHLLRLSAVKEIGYYTPNIGFYGGEEKDLCIRLLNQNYEIMLLPGVHVWHDKTLLERDIASQHRSGVCNDLAFALRRCPYPMVLWLLPAKVFSHIKFSSFHGLIKPCLEGIALFFKEIPKLLSTRKPVRHSVFQEFRRRLYLT